eukprot:COSAG01_NODE_46942_length_395_cov_0.881757_1_plen_56_part_01
MWRGARWLSHTLVVCRVPQDGAAVIELILAKHAEEQQRWTRVRSELLALRPRALQK